MGVDYGDIFSSHRFAPDTPPEEAMGVRPPGHPTTYSVSDGGPRKAPS
ncbi:hypothetical protein ACH4FX_19290 [Streptomyces sp. NPDC018019]